MSETAGRQKLRMHPVMGVMDDATAAVDAASSYVIEKALLENGKLAVINIEHKLIEELMPYYDVIYRLENGRLQKIN